MAAHARPRAPSHEGPELDLSSSQQDAVDALAHDRSGVDVQDACNRRLDARHLCKHDGKALVIDIDRRRGRA